MNAWEIRIGGHTIPLDTLPLDDVVTLATGHELVWLDLIERPFANPGAYYDLVCLAAHTVGAAVPEVDRTIPAMRAFITTTLHQTSG